MQPNVIGALAALGLAISAHAAPPSPPAPDRATYLVILGDSPLAARSVAGTRGLGLAAQDEKLTVRRAMRSADADVYLRQLDAARGNILASAQRISGRPLGPKQIYRYATNGMALELSAAEAARVAQLQGVASVRRERILHLQTDAGPQWIGADRIWNGQVPGVSPNHGEGVVIGIIDTGINPSHPSFAATGGDGYVVQNARGHYYGLCASAQAQCNAKLIGIYDFTNEGTLGVDSVGHGSHVAGIAAGNVFTGTLPGNTVSLSRNVAGVASHANLIMYKGCNAEPIDSSSDGTCAESALVSAIDQATADQVDVINFSIGGGTDDPYALLADPGSDVHALFHARSTGIVIAVSAGNEGPGPITITEPATAPWVIAVANATHNRRFANSIGAFSGAANAPGTLAGQAYTAGYGPASIVYAGDYGNALCGVGTSQGVTPNGASNPFAPGTFHGEIVICDRGTYARVEKGYNVKAAGAGGFVLANAASDSESIVSDDHFLPATHLGYSEGQQLKAWVAKAGAHSGTISAVTAALNASFGDVLDASSSRGPYGFGSTLKPDITAPGDDILSAAQTGNGLALLSGTSMASPNVAGSAALVLAAHPDWTPAQVESALLGTALAGSVRLEDGATKAGAFDAGVGRVQPAAAIKAGLYLPLASDDFFAGSGSLFNPTEHGDVARLNRVSLVNENCFQQCNFTRTVADMSGGGSWQVTSTGTAGAVVKVTPNQFTLPAGGAQALAIAVDVSNARLPGSWIDAHIVLHKTAGGTSASDIALALSAYAAPGAEQPFAQIAGPAPGGNAMVQVSGLGALAHATFTPTSLAPAVSSNLSLGVDPNPAQVYAGFPGTGKQFVLFPNVYQEGVDTLSYGRIFVVEIASSNAPTTTLYAGIDRNGNGQPDADEQACISPQIAGSGVAARCVVDLRDAGPVNVWALVDVASGDAAATYAVSINSGIPVVNYIAPMGVPAQQLHVVGPGHVAAGANFPLRLFWGPAQAGDATPALGTGTYYAAVMIDGTGDIAPDALGLSGLVPLSLTANAGADDVIDALAPAAARGISVHGPELLQHRFIDVPPGVTTVEFDTSLTSGTEGALVFDAVRAEFPQASASADVASAPPVQASAEWTLDSITSSRNVPIPAASGRWYIATKYNNSKSVSALIGAKLTYGKNPAPTLSPGNYFNPQRSGHGIFISRASGQQVVDWYTFDEQGAPVWYLAQGAAPAAGEGAWNATLYRVVWDGSGGTPTAVGDVILTATSDDHAMFSWHLFGQAGSEAFQLIAAPACVTAGGSVNLNGEWYPPAQSGYGFDALVIPDQQFDAFYMYDDTGNPRWVVGAVGPFSATATIPMLQSTGFCPICAYRALTTQAAGSMTVSYADGTSGQLSTSIALLSPLSGAWNISQPISRLTGSSACAQ